MAAPTQKKNGAAPAGAARSRQEMASAAVNGLPEAEKAAVTAAALQGLPDVAKVNIATSAVAAMPDAASAEAARRMLEDLPAEHKRHVLTSLFPDQSATNDIWRWSVLAFVFVLAVVTLGVIAAVIVSFWQDVDEMLVQVLLTLFTTTAGTLAGFVSGRASAPRPAG